MTALPTERHCTLQEVAAELGCTRQRAQQIEAEAMRKVREALEAQGITAADLVDRDDPEALWPGVK